MTKKSLPKPDLDGQANRPEALKIERPANQTMTEAATHAALRPTIQAAVTLLEYNKAFGELSINALVDDLVQQCTLASDGDLKRPEAMLIAHAHTLDGIFNNLARRASLNMGEYMNAAEVYMRLALKAQTQCRAALETLAMMKNPAPVTLVRQANIAHGPQQVNNGPPAAGDHARARESENQPSKLLEQQHEERLDGGTLQTPIAVNSNLEALGEVHRAKNGQR